MIGRIIGLLSVPMFVFVIWSLIRQVRRPAPVRPGWTAIGIVMAPFMLIINLVFLRQAAPGALGIALLVFGIGFGAAWGFTARLSMRNEKVIADRSILHLIFWAVSFGLTQLLATFALAEVVAGGLAAMFFATGTTLGTSTNLLVRQLQIRRQAALTTGRPR
ncbi:MAG: hypothetical protein U9N79_07855 [Actinomycetota bacterium]|nr:hypothetical protein [Actinomycetota bacterium]